MTEQTFKDRSSALIAMGIVEILGGVLAAAFCVLMIVITQLQPSEYPVSYGLMPAVVYGALAAWLLVMGIGTIRKTRWARVLMLAACWFSLITGIGAMGMMATMFTGMTSRPDIPKEIALIVLTITGIIFSVIYLLVPLIGILFYNGRNVRATCENRHPDPSWTERCPLPILILVLLMVISFFSGAMQIMTNFVFPFFGTLLCGISGMTAWAANSVFSALIAIGLYKLKPAAWWGVLAYYAILILSSTLTFSRITMSDFYTAANYSEAMRAQIQQSPWMTEAWLLKISLLYALPVLIYLLFVKRYFEKSKPEEPENV